MSAINKQARKYDAQVSFAIHERARAQCLISFAAVILLLLRKPGNARIHVYAFGSDSKL